MSNTTFTQRITEHFSVFSVKEYRLYWLGWLCYQLAQQVFSYTTIQWFYHLTNSELLIGQLSFLVVLICIPSILLGGVLADKFDRKRFILITIIIMAVIFALLGLDILLGFFQTWHLYFFYTVQNMVALFGISAWSGLLNHLLPKAKMHAAIPINVGTIYFIAMLSPLLFMLGYHYIGPISCYLLCLLSLLITGICFLGIHPMTPTASSKGDAHPINMLKQGIHFLASSPVILGLFLLDIGVTVVSFYRTLFPIIVYHFYQGGVFLVGILGFVNALGGLIGALIMLSLKHYPHKGKITLMATLMYALILLPFSLIHVFLFGLLCIFVLSITDTISMSIRQSIVQVSTPDHLLARTSSFRSLFALGANFLGQTLLASFSGLIGPTKSLILGSLIATTVVLVIWTCFAGIYRYTDAEHT